MVSGLASMDPGRLSAAGSARQVDALADEVLGVPVTDATGTIHVSAVWHPEPGRHVVMRIGSQTPRSTLDFFFLNLSRAMAGAIVITGKLLRDEPGLHYALQGAGRLPAGLGAWRREVVGESSTPRLAVLTSGRDINPDHPVWQSPVRPIVFTHELGQSRLRGLSVPVVVLPQLSVRSVVAHLREELGIRRVTLEAGPSTTRELYRSPFVVDSVLLSRFEEPSIPEAVRGGDLFEGGVLARNYRRRGERAWEEPSGRWTFGLWRRAAGKKEA